LQSTLEQSARSFVAELMPELMRELMPELTLERAE